MTDTPTTSAADVEAVVARLEDLGLHTTKLAASLILSLQARLDAVEGQEAETQALRAKVNTLSRGDCITCHGSGAIEDGSFCSSCEGSGIHGGRTCSCSQPRIKAKFKRIWECADCGWPERIEPSKNELQVQADEVARLTEERDKAAAWQWRYKKAGAKNWGAWNDRRDATLEAYTDYLSEKRALYASPHADFDAALKRELAEADEALTQAQDATSHWVRVAGRAERRAEAAEARATTAEARAYEDAARTAEMIGRDVGGSDTARMIQRALEARARAALAGAETQEKFDGN